MTSNEAISSAIARCASSLVIVRWTPGRTTLARVLLMMLMAGCLAACSSWRPLQCSDGLQCPDGAICAADQPVCITTPCGNGVKEYSEECDDGNIITGDGCNRTCQREGCGNGIVDVREVCDDGNSQSGDGCSAWCRSEYCGNGVINRETREQCDDQNYIPGDNCSPLCLDELCGNGILDEAIGEVCDDGNSQSGDGCSDKCLSEYCGNDTLNSNLGEQCDDGNLDAGDGCSGKCVIEFCGNGIVDADESCDDRNAFSGDGCSSACESEYCGNGIADVGEVCDDGNTAPGDGCSPMCNSEVCGDGKIDRELGESCDDGNIVAGDGCSSVCQREACGNGILDPRETCDDGNMVAGDGCSEACYSEYCGNGTIELGEACEDGNRISGDGCSLVCQPEVCGNRIIDPGETCDDGNVASGDGCGAACYLESCGNGTIEPGESCEDGNTVAGDGCSSTCQSEYCGNGIVDAGEECDDGDATTGDGCSDSCNLALTQIVAGAAHTCTLLATGAVRCWGFGGDGRLGYGNTESIGDDETPASAGDVSLGGSAVQLAAGGNHMCALLATGAVRCWGDGSTGQLGYGNIDYIGDNEVPALVGDMPLGGFATELAAGLNHTCALLTTGVVRCWGHNDSGQLGYGHTQWIGDDETPASAGNVPLDDSAIQLVAGREHTCALLEAGAVRCWGAGDSGQLGYGNTDNIGDDETPASTGDVPLGGPAIQLAAGAKHTCALLETGAVRCWGAGDSGQLGYGNTDNIGDDETPASTGDVSLGGSAIQLIAGDDHGCVLLSTGGVRCWGAGNSGQLGYGNTDNIGDDETPASAGDVSLGGSAIQLATGYWHTCTLLTTGAVRCWGYGMWGQLGYGNIDNIGDDETPASADDVPILVSTP